mmetsp:Transcript_8800/g.24368  ORF Transcript_8800/g.24368 Transcript_8800/m.24368 type:complete len:114 (+) Transcript_8800:387-728(+)
MQMTALWSLFCSHSILRLSLRSVQSLGKQQVYSQSVECKLFLSELVPSTTRFHFCSRYQAFREASASNGTFKDRNLSVGREETIDVSPHEKDKQGKAASRPCHPREGFISTCC